MQTLKQLFIITLATALLIIAGLSLAETEWADSFRSFEPTSTLSETNIAVEPAQSEDGSEEPQVPGVLAFIGSFIKEAILMGIPAIVTISILGKTRPYSKKRKQRKRRGSNYEKQGRPPRLSEQG